MIGRLLLRGVAVVKLFEDVNELVQVEDSAASGRGPHNNNRRANRTVRAACTMRMLQPAPVDLGRRRTASPFVGRRVPVKCEATIGEMHIPPSSFTTVDVHGVGTAPRAGTLAGMATQGSGC